jgi:hypothetical protein
LVNPAELFKVEAAAGEIDAEDVAYWNVELAEASSEEALLVEVQPIAITIAPAPVPEPSKVDWLAQRRSARQSERRTQRSRDPLHVPSDWFADEPSVRPPARPEPIPVQLALF